MTQTTSNATTPHPAVVALPAKAVSTEDWQPNGDGRYYRNFEGEVREIVAGRRYGAHAVAVYAHAVQHDDGGIIDNGPSDPVFEPPGISMLTIDDEHGRPTDIGLTLTGAAARSLADVLVSAADEVDRWSTR
jgi:hypothetical protein